jgi:hypothetical protein
MPVVYPYRLTLLQSTDGTGTGTVIRDPYTRKYTGTVRSPSLEGATTREEGIARVGQRDGGTGGVGSTYRGEFESTRELTCVGSGLVMLVVM